MPVKTKKQRKNRRRTLRRKTKGGSTSQSLQIPTAALKVSEGGLNSDNKWHGI
jgi:hypothetical protein